MKPSNQKNEEEWKVDSSDSTRVESSRNRRAGSKLGSWLTSICLSLLQVLNICCWLWSDRLKEMCRPRWSTFFYFRNWKCISSLCSYWQVYLRKLTLKLFRHKQFIRSKERLFSILSFSFFLTDWQLMIDIKSEFLIRKIEVIMPDLPNSGFVLRVKWEYMHILFLVNYQVPYKF